MGLMGKLCGASRSCLQYTLGGIAAHQSTLPARAQSTGPACHTIIADTSADVGAWRDAPARFLPRSC